MIPSTSNEHAVGRRNATTRTGRPAPAGAPMYDDRGDSDDDAPSAARGGGGGSYRSRHSSPPTSVCGHGPKQNESQGSDSSYSSSAAAAAAAVTVAEARAGSSSSSASAAARAGPSSSTSMAAARAGSSSSTSVEDAPVGPSLSAHVAVARAGSSVSASAATEHEASSFSASVAAAASAAAAAHAGSGGGGGGGSDTNQRSRSAAPPPECTKTIIERRSPLVTGCTQCSTFALRAASRRAAAHTDRGTVTFARTTLAQLDAQPASKPRSAPPWPCETMIARGEEEWTHPSTARHDSIDHLCSVAPRAARASGRGAPSSTATSAPPASASRSETFTVKRERSACHLSAGRSVASYLLAHPLHYITLHRIM